MHAFITFKYTGIWTSTSTHECTHAHAHAHTHTHTHMHTHTHTHTQAQTHTHTQAHTYTQLHTALCSLLNVGQFFWLKWKTFTWLLIESWCYRWCGLNVVESVAKKLIIMETLMKDSCDERPTPLLICFRPLFLKHFSLCIHYMNRWPRTMPTCKTICFIFSLVLKVIKHSVKIMKLYLFAFFSFSFLFFFLSQPAAMENILRMESPLLAIPQFQYQVWYSSSCTSFKTSFFKSINSCGMFFKSNIFIYK